MQTVTFETKKLNLVELVMAIDTEVMLDKVLGYVRKKMNEPEMKYEIATEDESVMLREETIEAINEARNRQVYEDDNLFTSAEEMFKTLDAE